MIPGEIISKNKKIILNADKETATVLVANIGDRPIQIGSHFHFFEANKSLKFHRQIAFGMHLDIASGTAVRFEPGEEKEVQLVSIGGSMEIYGFNGLVNGKVTDPLIKEAALVSAKEKGFII